MFDAGRDVVMNNYQDCFHCGLPVPAASNWQVKIDDVKQAMCCPGCEAVAQTIVDNNLTSYYRDRLSFSDKPTELIPDALRLYDTQEQLAQFETDTEGKLQGTFSIEGIRCGACVWLIEKHVAKIVGVQATNVNLSTEKLHVMWDGEQCKPSDIVKAVRELGYAAYPFDPLRHGEIIRKNAKTLFRQLFIAGLSMMQVMMYAVPVYLADADTMDKDMEGLMRWASLFLTLPAVLYSAQPFFKNAWANIKHRALGMDVPVALGIAAAFIGSVFSTVTGHGDVYFDSVTMFIFLLLCSRYLELIARRRAASTLETMQHTLPSAAWLCQDYPESREPHCVPAAQLRVGQVILVKPGEAIPADSVIVEGNTSVDLSLLTGESQPQKKIMGERLPGGAVNVSQAILLRVEKLAKDSTLHALIRLIEQAGVGKPKIAQWADRVAAWFVSTLLIFACAVLIFWGWVDPVRAWPIAIAVLVVSCPCALSLATPSALAAATDALLRQGVLIMQPHVLETLHRATHIVFDKTGTLTEGQPKLEDISLMGDKNRTEVLQLAAAIEEGSAHPVAAMLIQAAQQSEQVLSLLNLEDIESYAGQGLACKVDGVLHRIGNAKFITEIAGTIPATLDEIDHACVYLGNTSGWLARFTFNDALRSDAQAVIDYFQAQHKTVILLSGDAEHVVKKTARQCGIAIARGGVLPAEKLAYVKNLQAQGALVTMVGDGMNDAAVLHAADVSFAMGSGAALAQSHADAVLMTARLSALRDTAETAAQTMRVIRQNLSWATLYNLVAIPAAAWGLLSPWMAGVGMSISSALVVGNALRLAHFTHKF
jgi:Cu2+-exporting ATPase